MKATQFDKKATRLDKPLVRLDNLNLQKFEPFYRQKIEPLFRPDNAFRFLPAMVNWFFDMFFYDVRSLDLAEWPWPLTPRADEKGAIIVVSPRGKEKIHHYSNPHTFMLKEGKDIQAIAVAGVGSSGLGTAALAQNVADHTGWKVAGIISGYGRSDWLMEGLGGWLYYGLLDRFRYKFGQFVERVCGRAPALGGPATQQSDGQPRGILSMSPPVLADQLEDFSLSMGGINFFIEQCNHLAGLGYTLPGYPMGSYDVLGDSDVRTLHDILSAGREKLGDLKLLVSHSKGNLLISFVLNHIMDGLAGDKDPLFEDLIIVTLGAVVDIPEAFRPNTHQFLGQLDLLGRANSRSDAPIFDFLDPCNLWRPITIPYVEIPGVMHHLNPLYSCYMSVSEVLEEVRRVHTNLTYNGKGT